MKPTQAILLTAGTYILCSLIRFNVYGKDLPLISVVIVLSSIWIAVDSSKLQFQRFESAISLRPFALFILSLFLWVIVYPWYLSMRYKIDTGGAKLKAPLADVAV